MSRLGRISLLSIAFTFIFGCNSNPYVQGERLYTFHCSSCHMSEGEGMAQLYPPLAKADYLDENLGRLPCIIREGLSDTITVNGVIFDQPMAGNKELTNAEIANICNYISHRWYNQAMTFSESEISNILGACTK